MNEEIAKEYEKMTKRHSAMRQKIANETSIFVTKYGSICDHPEKYQYRWSDDCDNGYGKWWKIPRMRCIICNKSFYRYGDTEDWKRSDV